MRRRLLSFIALAAAGISVLPGVLAQAPLSASAAQVAVSTASESVAGVVADAQVITGTILEAGTDEPVIGATVVVVGEDGGTVTDYDGKYSITVADAETAVLRISYVGMETIDVAVSGRSVVDVVLGSNSELLEEIVVVGYGVQKRSNISGAVGSVTAEEIAQSPVTRIESALQGRTAGVQVAAQSGSPGAPLTVRIRGTGTINNADPLYVVDGVPVDGIDFLNPGDIESINVLKDAASAAIYGARGANGVVLITTKTGTQNSEGVVTYDGYVGFQEPWRKVSLLNAREYATIVNEARVNSGLTPRPELRDPSLFGEGTDWQDAIFERAPIQSHQVSFRGGSEQGSIGVSGSYLDQDGVIGGDRANFERYTARVTARQRIKAWLTIGTNVNFTRLQRSALSENNEFNSPLIRALNLDPLTPVRRADGAYAYSVYTDTDIANPVNAIEQTHGRYTSNRAVGSAYAEVEPIEGLTFRSAYSVDATFGQNNTFAPLYDLSLDTLLNDAPTAERNDVSNSVFRGDDTWTNWQWENVATYHRAIDERHDLTGTLGMTALERRYEYAGGANTNLPSNDPADAFISNTIDPIASQSAYGGAEESSLYSYFARVNYELDDRYVLQASLRRDASSLFGVNFSAGYFPAFSAAWIVSREAFWPQGGPVDFLKVRGSWGQTGNDRIGVYRYSAVVNAGQNYTFGAGEVITNGAVPLRPANPDLRWETSTQANFGVDVDLLDGRLQLTADLFDKQTSDMLYEPEILLVAGTLPPTQNIGTMVNRGVELSTTYRQRVGSDFDFSVSANASFIDTEVLSLGGDDEFRFTGRIQSANASVARTAPGSAVAGFYGYVTDGIFQDAGEIAAAAFQSERTQPGDIRFADLNGDGVIDELDQRYIGDPNPDIVYGANLDLGFRGFDLNLFLQGSHGNDIYNATVRYDFPTVNRPTSVLNRWTGPGTSDSEPRVSVSDPNQNARISDRFVEDGSFLRVRNLQLGYSLPDALLRKARLEKVRLYVGVQNLYTWTRYSGLDPEIGTYRPLESGIDRGYYPQSRNWLTGLNLVF